MATGIVGYRFNDSTSMYAGYRAVSWDYDDGSGSNNFEWDVTLHGPMLGFGYRF